MVSYVSYAKMMVTGLSQNAFGGFAVVLYKGGGLGNLMTHIVNDSKDGGIELNGRP